MTPRTAPRSGRRAAAARGAGFTLIEVLVALAVVAIALGAGAKAAAALTGNAERLHTMSAAQWCVENQLVELRLQRQFPGVGESRFACEQLGMGFEGRIVVSPTLNPNFRRLDATVGNPDTPALLTLTTIVGRY